MTKKRLTIVEINIFDQMLPLVAAYLQAYACTDPVVQATYSFDKYTTTVKTPFLQLVEELSAKDSLVSTPQRAAYWQMQPMFHDVA